VRSAVQDSVSAVVTERNWLSLTWVNIARLRNGDSIFVILFMPDRDRDSRKPIHDLAAAARCSNVE
jgi:hypothetical protein